MNDPVSILSKTPPSRWKFSNIGKANARILELESQLAARQVGLPAPPATATLATANPARPAAQTVSTAALLKSYRAVDKSDTSLNNLTQPTAEIRAKIASKCWQERLNYAGCDADFAALDTGKLHRHVSDENFSGLERSATAFRQAKFDTALRQNSK